MGWGPRTPENPKHVRFGATSNSDENLRRHKPLHRSWSPSKSNMPTRVGASPGLKSSIESLRDEFKVKGASFAKGKKDEPYPYIRNIYCRAPSKNSTMDPTSAHNRTVKAMGDHDYSAIDALGLAPANPISKVTFNPIPKFSAIDALEFDDGKFSNPLRRPEFLRSPVNKTSATPPSKPAAVEEYVIGPDGWPTKSANMTVPRKPAVAVPSRPTTEELPPAAPVDFRISNDDQSPSPDSSEEMPHFSLYAESDIMSWITDATYGSEDYCSSSDDEGKYHAYIRNNLNEPDPFRNSDKLDGYTSAGAQAPNNRDSSESEEDIISPPRSDKAVHGASSIYHAYTGYPSKHASQERLTELYRRRCDLYRHEHRIRRMVLDLDEEIEKVERGLGRRMRIRDV